MNPKRKVICFMMGREFGRIETHLRGTATSISRGDREGAIENLENAIEYASTIRPRLRSKNLTQFLKKATRYQENLASKKRIKAGSSQLSKNFNPVFNSARRAMKDAEKTHC